MPNRLRKLESSITHCRHKNGKKAKKGPTSPGTVSKADNIGGAPPLMTPVNYTVPGHVPPLQRRDATSGWATAFTMLMSWKNDETVTVPTALARVHSKWLDLYNGKQGLTGQNKVEFLAASGVIAEPPQNFSVQGWEDLLRSYGPLWLTTDDVPDKPWGINARVISGINGDGTPSGTAFAITNPATGRESKEKLSVFIPKYEAEVRRSGSMRMQVLHLSTDARLAPGKLAAGRNVFALQATQKPAPAAMTLAPAAPTVVAPTPGSASPAPQIVPVDLDAVVRKLIADGADATALLTFLKDINAPVSADVIAQLGQPGQALALSGEPNITVTIPTPVILEEIEAMAFKASLSAALLAVPNVGRDLAALFNALPAVANEFEVAIGIGPIASGSLAEGSSLTEGESIGAGVLFAPGNKIGFFGNMGEILRAIKNISGNLRATVIKGGHENFGGTAMLVGVTVGPGINAHAIIANNKFKGVTAEIAVSKEPSQIKALAEFQYTPTSLSLDAYAEQYGGPVLFGIAGLTAVTAVEIGLAGIALLQPLTVSDGSLQMVSDQASRLLDNDARAKLGAKAKNSYSYPLLWVGEIKRGFADALFEVKWEGNDYGEIAGLRVVRNIHKTTTWTKSSLNLTFKRLKTLPPADMGDPREWPIVFEYDGSFDPYGNGHFTFQGQFACNSFGGLKFLKHEISDKSFISFLKLGKKADYVRRKPDQSYTVATIPADQLTYVKTKLGI